MFFQTKPMRLSLLAIISVLLLVSCGKEEKAQNIPEPQIVKNSYPQPGKLECSYPKFICNDIAAGITPQNILTPEQKNKLKQAILNEISTKESWKEIQKDGDVFSAACASTTAALFIKIKEKYNFDFLPMFTKPVDFPLTHQIERALWHLGFNYVDAKSYIPQQGDIGCVERYFFVEPNHTGHIFVVGKDMGYEEPDYIYDNVGYFYINPKLKYNIFTYWTLSDEAIPRDSSSSL